MIINLTQHKATPEQVAAGVVDVPADYKQELTDLLTFSDLPSGDDIEYRAEQLAKLAVRLGASHAMIGGAPYLMGSLQRALVFVYVEPLYAFSERVAVDEHWPDGSVTKTQVFKHLGFVKVDRV